MRLMIYSHDTFGLGNIRRMLAICKALRNFIPGLSILLISGSPMLHSFRLPAGLDYIKLPCLNRGERGELAVKYLGTQTDETLQLRSDLILAAAANYKPDLLLVDKKPNGVSGELAATLAYLKTSAPSTKLVLLLRDILDSPEVTIAEWQSRNYHQAIDLFYDQVLVVGMQSVFDVTKEYQFPLSTSAKVRFCGYIRKESGLKSREVIRQQLQVKPQEKLVLVTPGGGEDGYNLVKTYLGGLMHLSQANVKSLIVCGPEMPAQGKQNLYQAAQKYPHVQIGDFTDDLISYMDAADAIVAMGGYNTITEILSLGKRAVVVPRVQPVQEQWIRAFRLSQLGLLQTIHPDRLTSESLINTLLSELNNSSNPLPRLDLDALPRIARYIYALLSGEGDTNKSEYLYLKRLQTLCLTTAIQK